MIVPWYKSVLQDYANKIFIVFSSYQIKVPHYRLNEAIREIYSLEGKITDVSLLGIDTE